MNYFIDNVTWLWKSKDILLSILSVPVSQGHAIFSGDGNGASNAVCLHRAALREMRDGR